MQSVLRRFLIRTYLRVTSAKLNSFLSHSILLFADLYKVYQTIPIISSKSSGLSLYFPDFFGANPCFSTPWCSGKNGGSHSDTGALDSIQLHIHTGSNKSTLWRGSKMKKWFFAFFYLLPLQNLVCLLSILYNKDIENKVSSAWKGSVLWNLKR